MHNSVGTSAFAATTNGKNLITFQSKSHRQAQVTREVTSNQILGDQEGKKIINLPGKQTPNWGNTSPFRSSQQLPVSDPCRHLWAGTAPSRTLKLYGVLLLEQGKIQTLTTPLSLACLSGRSQETIKNNYHIPYLLVYEKYNCFGCSKKRVAWALFPPPCKLQWSMQFYCRLNWMQDHQEPTLHSYATFSH